jgi:hypothetical protein
MASIIVILFTAYFVCAEVCGGNKQAAESQQDDTHQTRKYHPSLFPEPTCYCTDRDICDYDPRRRHFCQIMHVMNALPSDQNKKDDNKDKREMERTQRQPRQEDKARQEAGSG